ncbi:hypothetical protein L226DRAFT_148922 [Lentinus tigrinus ALCF2SS1-7]|nr:hypothetical protein L226DRAFT_148922 [Lentinus tigrinus ALCF2SS1-7]
MASSSSREPSRYERIDSPPPSRYRNNIPSDSVPQRRGREAEMSDPEFDNSKRRRLNDDFASSRRGPTDLVAPIASLPPKPIAAPPSYEASQVDQQHRKRAPLPPQREQWIRSDHKPAPVQQPQPQLQQSSQHPPFPPRPIRIPSPIVEPDGLLQWTTPDGRKETINQATTMPPGWMGWGNVPLYDTPSGRLSRMSGLPNPWDMSKPWPPPKPKGWKPSTSDPPLSAYYPNPRLPDAMDVDIPPPSRGPPMSRVDPGPRNGMGGMYSDRMPSAPQEAPRAPRAMVPRDGGSYSGMASSSTSLPNMYGRPAEPPSHEGPGASSSRGRLQPPRSPVDQRRWGESSPVDRRASYSGANPMEPPTIAPPKQVVRDLPERPMPIGRAPTSEPRGRGRPTGDTGPRPPRMSGTNSVPVGPRTATSYESVPSAQSSPFHANDNGYGSRRGFANERDDVPDPYGKKPMRYAPPPDEPFSDRSRVERGGDRGSERGGRRSSVSDPMRGPPEERQPSRGGTSPVQSRHGSTYPNSQSEPTRLWQTRDEVQTLRAPTSRSQEEFVPREPRQYGRSTYDSEVPRPDRVITPPPHEEERPPAVKVHPDRARLLAVPAPPPQDSAPNGARGRRPGPDRGYAGARDFDDRVRDPPPHPDERMGPPRDRSPQNGFRPNMKRGGSLLERLNIHDSPPRDSASSLRERVDVVAHVDPVSVARTESVMNVDSEGPSGPAGDDGSKGNGGRGPGKRRNGKPRRGRRNGGGP